MAVDKRFLRVRAGNTDKTYIGADFCPGERGLADMCDSANPLLVIDINFARQAVQNGASVPETMAKYDLNTEPNSKRMLVQNCLGQIAGGQCQVYPLQEA